MSTVEAAFALSLYSDLAPRVFVDVETKVEIVWNRVGFRDYELVSVIGDDKELSGEVRDHVMAMLAQGGDLMKALEARWEADQAEGNELRGELAAEARAL